MKPTTAVMTACLPHVLVTQRIAKVSSRPVSQSHGLLRSLPEASVITKRNVFKCAESKIRKEWKFRSLEDLWALLKPRLR
jgi:hypothetical protein